MNYQTEKKKYHQRKNELDRTAYGNIIQFQKDLSDSALGDYSPNSGADYQLKDKPDIFKKIKDQYSRPIKFFDYLIAPLNSKPTILN